MTRLLFGFILLAAIGCTGIQPAGPFAKNGMLPGGGSRSDKDAPPPDPVTIPAPKPTPPLTTVSADDVTADNAYLKAQQVSAEIDADRKSMPAAPVTVETSVYKGGVKQ
jgi:hypothetical protein